MYLLIRKLIKLRYFDYLSGGLIQANYPCKFSEEKDVIKALAIIIDQIKPDFILKEIEQFIEDPSKETWINRYSELFDQLTNANS